MRSTFILVLAACALPWLAPLRAGANELRGRIPGVESTPPMAVSSANGLGQLQNGSQATTSVGPPIFDIQKVPKLPVVKEYAENRSMTQHNADNDLEAQAEQSDAKQKALERTEKAYRKVLRAQTRKKSPLEWASAQNNLGVTLVSEGMRSEGEKSQKLLRQAEEAFNKALQVYTRQQSPQQWAAAQNNLGFALQAEGEQTQGEKSRELLGRAVQAYRSALQVFTHQQFPFEEALVETNLSRALGKLSNLRAAM